MSMLPLADVDWSRCERLLIAADGADLACWHLPGDGRRWVVWLHGACGNHLMWGRQIDAFDGFDHVFVDIRGHGESPMHVGRAADFEDTVADIGRILDHVGAERAVIVGHSWGGNPAQEFAHRHPERTDALVMIGAWGQLRPMSPSELRRVRVMSKLYRFVPWKVIAPINAKACSDEPETRSAIAAAMRDTGRDVFLDLGLSAYERVHEVDTYPAHTPTLLVRGDGDFPAMLAPIYAQIRAKNPAASEAVIAGTRHMPMIDTPAEFNRVLTEFLASGPDQPER